MQSDDALGGTDVGVEQTTDEQLAAAAPKDGTSVAREINDALAHTFTGILLQLRVAERIAQQDPDEAWRLVARAADLAQQGLAEARRALSALQSDAAECIDIVAGLTGFIDRERAATGAEIVLHVGGPPREMTTAVGQSVMRIAEEAVTNALRHADPRIVRIDLVFGATDVRLRVKDDGCGFDMDSRGITGDLGLVVMSQRAAGVGGHLAISSQAGRGTEVSVIVPAPPTAGREEP